MYIDRGNTNMRKRVKMCEILISGQYTNVVNNDCSNIEKKLFGVKNNVMRDLKKYLKNVGFAGHHLTNTMNAINKTSKLYRDVSGNKFSTTVNAFNLETGKVYTFIISYKVYRLLNCPNQSSYNLKNENIYEKRLIQRYGGGRIGRYKLAFSKISINNLIDLLSDVIKEEFKKNISLHTSTFSSDIYVNCPDTITLQPVDNLQIRFEFVHSGNGFFRFKQYARIFYNDIEVDFSINRKQEITEEDIEQVIELGKKFDEICEIVKKAYNL